MRKTGEPANVLLTEGEGNLPQRSVVVVSQLSVVEKAQLCEPIGRLSRDRVDVVLTGLLFQQADQSKNA